MHTQEQAHNNKHTMPFSRKSEPFDLDARGLEPAEFDTITEAAEPLHHPRSPKVLRDVATISCGGVPVARAAPRGDAPDAWPALPRPTRGRRAYCDAAKMRPWEMTGARAVPLCQPLEPPCEPLEPSARPTVVALPAHDAVTAWMADGSEEARFDDASAATLRRDSRAERARRHEARVGRNLFARAFARREGGGVRMARAVRRWPSPVPPRLRQDVGTGTERHRHDLHHITRRRTRGGGAEIPTRFTNLGGAARGRYSHNEKE